MRLKRYLILPLALLVILIGLSLLASCSDERTSSPLAPGLDDGAPVGDPVKTRTDTFTLRAYDLDSVHMAGSMNDWATEDPAWELTLLEDGYTWQLVKTHDFSLLYYKFIIRKDADMEWLTPPNAVELSPSGGGGGPSYYNAVHGREFATPRPLGRTIDRSKLVIYELNLNDFSATGTFAGAVPQITSGANLSELGVNAIELLPITAPSYNGWGYDPVLQWAPNPSFGWPFTLSALIDEAHEHDIAVIVDVVVNHMAGSAPLRQLDDFTGTYNFTTAEGNPWGMVELNWGNQALREHIRDGLLQWVETYNIDGFRFDYIGGEGYGTWLWLKNQLKERHPDLLLIAEDFSYPANAVTYGYDAQWGGQHTDQWGGGGNNFNQVMVTALTEAGFASRGWLTPEVGAFGPQYNNMWAVANVLSGNSNYAGPATGDGFSDVKYLESHDENRLVWAVGQMGSSGAQTIGGAQKACLGAVANMTCVGIPMMFNGTELGSDEYRPADPTIYKIDYSGGDQELRDIYKRLIHLRLNMTALQSENIFFLWRDGGLDQSEYTITYWRGTTDIGADAEVVVAMNFDHQDHDWFVPFPADGQWVREDLAAGDGTLELIDGGGLNLTVPASTAIIWTRNSGLSHVP